MFAHHGRLRPLLASAAIFAALCVCPDSVSGQTSSAPTSAPADVGAAVSPSNAVPHTAGEKVLALPSSSTNTSLALTEYAEGLKAERAGDTAEALKHFQAAVDADPKLTEVATRLAATYLKQGNYTAALRQLQSLAKQKPGDLRLKETIAFVLALNQRPDQARTAARAILASHTHNLAGQVTLFEIDRYYFGESGAVLALASRSGAAANGSPWWIQMGEAYARLLTDHTPLDAPGVSQRALPLFEQALLRAPTNVTLLARVADLRSLVGRYSDAAEAYQTLSSLFPDRNELRLHYALACAGARDTTNAITALRDLLKRDPTVAARNLPLMAELHYLEGNRSAARQSLLEAVTAGAPALPCANLALRQRDYATAREVLTRAIAAVPGDNSLALRLADVLTLQKDAPAAIDHMRALIQRNPASLDLKAAAAGVAREVGRFDDALAWLDECDRIAGPNALPAIRAELAFQRGSLLERMGRFPEAETALRQALTLTPDSPKILNYLGFSLADRGEKLDEARTMIEKAVKAEPDNAAYLDSLAWVNFRQNRNDEALRLILDALAVENEEPEILEHLGQVHLALGHEQLALDAFNRSLAGDPKRESARKLRDAVAVRFEPAP